MKALYWIFDSFTFQILAGTILVWSIPSILRFLQRCLSAFVSILLSFVPFRGAGLKSGARDSFYSWEKTGRLRGYKESLPIIGWDYGRKGEHDGNN